MRRKYLKSNLYNEQGIVILSKGQEISNGLLQNLETLDYLNSDYLKYKNEVTNKIEQLQKNLGINNIQLINSSSKIVTSILSESKNQPWCFHVNTLSNHVDWLYTHSINVSILSTMIAQVLAIKEIKEIALGAFLHDIGKLMIPINIIQKPGKLTEEEFFYIRQHCDLGISMLKDFDLPQISLDIIQQHHERMDGCGYPQRLTASQIPLHSRIVIIADVLDAITSYRPYKSEKQVEVAIAELKKDSEKYPQEILKVISSILD